MNARFCLALLLGLILTPAIQAQALITSGVSDAAYFHVEAGQNKASLVDEYLSASLTKHSDLDAVAPMAAARTVGSDLGSCRLDNCANVRTALHAASGVKLEAVLADGADQGSEFHPANSENDWIAVFDTALMLLFALGLLAYPLVRRQRALLHSSALASYFGNRVKRAGDALERAALSDDGRANLRGTGRLVNSRER
jgi:hypothetical protein